jgi:hypothetical protein
MFKKLCKELGRMTGHQQEIELALAASKPPSSLAWMLILLMVV